MSKQKYFSVFDTDTKDYLHSGRNSKTKKEAINDGVEFILGGGDIMNPSQIRRMSLKRKEVFLRAERLIVEEHDEKIPDEFDDDNEGKPGTQRSPFGIGS